MVADLFVVQGYVGVDFILLKIDIELAQLAADTGVQSRNYLVQSLFFLTQRLQMSAFRTVFSVNGVPDVLSLVACKLFGIYF